MRLIPTPIPGACIKLYQVNLTETQSGAVHDPAGAYATAQTGARSWRVHVTAGMCGNDGIAILISTDTYVRRRLAVASEFLASVSRPSSASDVDINARPRRSGRTHQAMLQALDGARAGASQRDIAAAIYGVRLVSERWTPDGDLRARIRYFLRRGRALVNGGYRKLPYL